MKTKLFVILFVFATAQLSWAQTSLAPSKEWMKDMKEVVLASNQWKSVAEVVPGGINSAMVNDRMWEDIVFAYPTHTKLVSDLRGDYTLQCGKGTHILKDTVLQVWVSDLSVPFYIPLGVDVDDPKFLLPLYEAGTMCIVKSYAPSGQGQDMLADAKKSLDETSDRADKIANVEWVEKDKSFVVMMNGKEYLYQKNSEGQWESEDPDAPKAIKAGDRKKDPTFIFSKNADGEWAPVTSNKRNGYKFGMGDYAGYSQNYYRHARNGAPLGSAGWFGGTPVGYGFGAPMMGGVWGMGGGYSTGWGFSMGWGVNSGWNIGFGGGGCWRGTMYPFMYSPMANGVYRGSSWGYYGGGYDGGVCQSSMMTNQNFALAKSVGPQAQGQGKSSVPEFKNLTPTRTTAPVAKTPTKANASQQQSFTVLTATKQKPVVAERNREIRSGETTLNSTRRGDVGGTRQSSGEVARNNPPAQGGATRQAPMPSTPRGGGVMRDQGRRATPANPPSREGAVRTPAPSRPQVNPPRGRQRVESASTQSGGGMRQAPMSTPRGGGMRQAAPPQMRGGAPPMRGGGMRSAPMQRQGGRR
jgi:hypothetical protein